LQWKMLQGEDFYKLLARIDADLARDSRARGCRVCGGKVHVACYGRKPRGALVQLATEYRWRWSFCCAARDCRRRLTPPSVRFLGRKVYLGAVVVLVSALRQGVTPTRLATLRELFGVSANTVRRWRRWWLMDFAEGTFWRAASGRLVPPIDLEQLPVSLLERITQGTEGESLARLLRLLSPVTTVTAGPLWAQAF
jgi:hypothetical protein